MFPASGKSQSSIQTLLGNERVREAFSFFEQNAAGITERQIEICEIAAPPFGEAPRAEFVRQRFVELGLKNARIDREGNCLALRSGKDKNSIFVVSAHLDTVFPAETDVRVRREDGKFFAPGIMDNCCGLTALLTLAEVFQKFGFQTEKPILFVGTVGEEAAGNLRGVRHLFTAGEFAQSISAFVSLDGAGAQQIVNGAIGSRRYKIVMRGVGGHSWLDFGAPNPVHAVGRAISKLTAFPLAKTARTTFNVGRVRGGTSVNAIAEEAIAEVDLRSEAEKELTRLDSFFRRAVLESVAEENAWRNQNYSALELDLELTGERPVGKTSEKSPLVRLAVEATRMVGVEPELIVSSTDSNFPMSLGIPAVTLGAGGAGDKMHTLGEWYDPTGREFGLQRALLLILGYAELTD